jgi:hypothetical protein
MDGTRASPWSASSPSEIESSMTGEPDFLSEPARWAPARHRSLRAAYEHAVRLLGAEERTALQRLADAIVTPHAIA